MVFNRNVDVHNYTHDQIRDILKTKDKCTAMVTFSMHEDAIMSNDDNVSAVYVISRKDLKKNIAHYRVHVYSEDFALLFTDDGLYDITKHKNFTSMFPSFDFI